MCIYVCICTYIASFQLILDMRVKGEIYLYIIFDKN